MFVENKSCTEKWLCKKDERSLHQVFHNFVANKGVGLSLYIWPSRKVLKGFLQNVYMIFSEYEKLWTV